MNRIFAAAAIVAGTQAQQQLVSDADALPELIEAPGYNFDLI